MTTIGIVGSRRRDTDKDYRIVEARLRSLLMSTSMDDAPRHHIVSGGCPKGADRFAEILAKKLGLSIIIHYADWDGKGRSAGFKRNTYIAQDADILIACVAPDRKGGTEDTIKKYLDLGKNELFLC